LPLVAIKFRALNVSLPLMPINQLARSTFNQRASQHPEQYLEEVMRVLPHWPDSRYLELAPNNWARTRAKLLPSELDAPFGGFTIPAA
jgi:hypothetical protein